MVVRQQVDKYDNYIPYPQYLKLLLRATDATTSGMRDFSGYGRVVTNSTGATGSTTQKKINPYSMYFDGTDDTISIPDSVDWTFDGDMTLLSWVNISTLSVGNEAFILMQATDSSNYQTFKIYNSSGTYQMNYQVVSSGSAVTNQYTTIPTPISNWKQFVVQKTGISFKYYCDGVELITFNGGNTPNFTGVLTVGSYLTNFYSGYIDSLFIWKGIAVPISQLYPQSKPFSFRRA